MVELSNLGLSHMGTSYDKTYTTLSRINPTVITLELSLFGYDGEVHLGKLLDSSAEELDFRERYISKSCLGGEFQAGYIFARRNDLPLYVIDKTIVTPDEVVNYNLMKMENPHDAFPYGKIPEELFDEWDYQIRNTFMAQVLDLLAAIYQTGHIAHVGGVHHVIRDNPEGAIPIQELVKRFEKVTPYVLIEDH